MPPSPPPAAVAATAQACRATTLYFDPADAKVQTRYGWAGKYNPGHCFLCTACLARETAAYPCPRMAKGRPCPIAGARFNKTRSSVERVCLATTGDRCRALLAESPHWAAAKAHARKKLGENGAFGIVLCKRFCLTRWRMAAAECVFLALIRSGKAGSKASGSRAPGPDPWTAPPDRRRRRSIDVVAGIGTASATKRIRVEPRLSTPAPSPPTAASSPWLALALGHMQLQTSMMYTERMRTRLAARERMYALGYTKEEMDRALNDAEGAMPGGV
ncbi:hypothetical protein GGF31_005035 [Allomyces arbusculus]|nr:hypothetical protein GGF31_005035 [Allomyces arbusculus]